MAEFISNGGIARTSKPIYRLPVTKAAKELVEIVSRLPEEKAQEVIDFARFLTQQAGDAAWERIIEDSRTRPKLDAFVADALREGESEPLEPDKL